MGILYEFEGKQLFKKNGIPVPRFSLYENKGTVEEFLKEIGQDEVMAKAQALGGGRGKAGLIKRVNLQNAEEYIQSILGRIHHGKPVEIVMLEEPLEISKEYYLAVMLDTVSGHYLILASSRGGVDIEEIAEKYPESFDFMIPEK